MRNWYFPALLAFVFWGLWALFPKITTRLIDPRSALFFQAVGAFSVALIVLATLDFRPHWEPRAVGLALLTGMLGMTGGIAYMYAIARGPAMLVSVLTALYPLLTVVLAWAFMGEQVGLRQWAGICLALLAMILLAG